jgi:hypothetical protein
VGRRHRGVPPISPNSDQDVIDILPGLAARADACRRINICIFHSLNGVRKQVCHWLCSSGFKHGFVRRLDALSVEVVLVLPIGTCIDLSVLSRYFGATWSVTQEFFTVDNCCRDVAMVQLLRKPFVIWKSQVEDPESKSDDNFDCWSSDDGGWEIRSVGSFGEA